MRQGKASPRMLRSRTLGKGRGGDIMGPLLLWMIAALACGGRRLRRAKYQKLVPHPMTGMAASRVSVQSVKHGESAQRTAAVVVVAHHRPHLHLLHLRPFLLLPGLRLPVLGIHWRHPWGLGLSLAHTTVKPDEGLVVHVAYSQKLREAWAWL